MKYLDKDGVTYLWNKIKVRLLTKQNILISGANIKSINNQSLLGSGNIEITSGDVLPIGIVMPYTSTNIPNGWLLCDGREVSRTTYSNLFDVIGTSFGSGDGSSTFNLPNLKGKSIIGMDSNDTDLNSIGKSGGEKTHQLTINEMPSHKHQIRSNKKTGGDSAAASFTWGTAYKSFDANACDTTGGDQPHNNMPPYVVGVYIIKA